MVENQFYPRNVYLLLTNDRPWDTMYKVLTYQQREDHPHEKDFISDT